MGKLEAGHPRQECEPVDPRQVRGRTTSSAPKKSIGPTRLDSVPRYRVHTFLTMEVLRPGERARAAGVNVQTLRYYERVGVLPAPKRTASGYRQYPADALRVLVFVKRAQELGFTLREVKELLKLRAAGPKQREKARE